MILVYITCGSLAEAKKIGQHLVRMKLAACVNIFPETQSAYYWPPKSKKLIDDKEVVLLVKTVKKNFKKIEQEVKKLHSYQNPAIFSIKVDQVSKPYLNWLLGEIE